MGLAGTDQATLDSLTLEKIGVFEDLFALLPKEFLRSGFT
jgi:hypothetical protein